MTLKNRIKCIQSEQKSMKFLKSDVKRLKQNLKDQISDQEDPFSIISIYGDESSKIEVSSNILRFLGFSDLTLLRIKRARYKQLDRKYGRLSNEAKERSVMGLGITTAQDLRDAVAYNYTMSSNYELCRGLIEEKTGEITEKIVKAKKVS